MYRSGSLLRAAKKTSTAPFFIRKVPTEVLTETKAALSSLNRLPRNQWSNELKKCVRDIQKRSMGHAAGIETEDLISRTRAALIAKLTSTLVTPQIKDPSNADKTLTFRYISEAQLAEMEKTKPELVAALRAEYKQDLQKYPELAKALAERNAEVNSLRNEIIKGLVRQEVAKHADDSVGAVHRAKFSFVTVEDYLKSSLSLSSNFPEEWVYQKSFDPNNPKDVFPTPTGLMLVLAPGTEAEAISEAGEILNIQRGWGALKVLVASFVTIYGLCYAFIWRNDHTNEWMESFEEVEKLERAFAYSYNQRYDDINGVFKGGDEYDDE